MKFRKIAALTTAAALILSLTACGSGAGTSGSDAGTEAIALLSVDAQAQIVNLKTDGLVDPIGLDDETPSFSWQMSSTVIGAAQSAYQIVVKDSTGSTVWDSDKVESQSSADIEYAGDALQAQTAYTWTVTVTDTAGNDVTSDEAAFETGLMSTSFDAWNGAQMIGAQDLSVDAAYTCVFDISADVTIPEGSTSASIIVGANDFRLLNDVYNVQSQEGENYVRLELDISGVGTDTGAAINAYRCGYVAGEEGETLVASVSGDDTLNAAITADNCHETHNLKFAINASDIIASIDGTELTGKKLGVNPLGDSSSYNTFPNLGEIGFGVRAGEKATYENVIVENGGTYGRGQLFGENVGATYSIFNGLTGVSVSGSTITVNGGSDGVVSYADPSYGSAPYLRKTFTAASEVASARLYVTAEGIYDFYINGQEIASDEWFNPGYSEYDAYLGYNTYDVTDYITAGDNAMGAVLGEGWWTGQMTYEADNSNYYGDQPALMVMLQLNYTDGTSETVVTDGTWDWYNDGPVRAASLFQGEDYDATKEAAIEGWTTAAFDNGSWEAAVPIELRAALSNVQLVTRTDNPVHVIETKTATLLGETKDGSGTYIYDMGENVSGVPYITIPDELAQAGVTVTVRTAEELYPELEEYTTAGIDGEMMVENYRAALSTDFYTMKESGNIIAPSLTFHGYRYIEIGGLSEAIPAENVQMLVLSSVDPTGTYESSNEMANTLYQNISNSLTSNYISIPTDCPQRNERMGWAGDAQIFALAGSYIGDTYGLLDTWMYSVVSDSNDETGVSMQYTPAFSKYDVENDTSIDHQGKRFGITWNAVSVTIPYNLYMQTGRIDIVEENIENIYKYVDYMGTTPFEYKNANGEKVSESRLTDEDGALADHLSRVTTDENLVGNVLYYELLRETAVMAEAVGDTDKAAAYEQKAEDAKTAWNEIFINSDGKTQDAAGEIQDTQASYATALRYGIVSDANLEKVTANYEKTISEASGEDKDGDAITAYTLTTGFNATGNVLNALSDYGMNDTAYKLFENTEYASWLYPVTQGATSIWEHWNSKTAEGGFNGQNSMNSFNHYSYGAVAEWMVGYQAGITLDENYPGYQQFILQPTPGGDYTDLAASYESSYGTISSAWTAENGELTSYDCVIPANTTATLYLPTEAKDATSLDGVKYVKSETHNGIAVQTYQLVAGRYHFEITDSGITVSAQ